MERIHADNNRTVSVSEWEGQGIFLSMQGQGFSTYVSMDKKAAEALLEAIQVALAKEPA